MNENTQINGMDEKLILKCSDAFHRSRPTLPPRRDVKVQRNSESSPRTETQESPSHTMISMATPWQKNRPTELRSYDDDETDLLRRRQHPAHMQHFLCILFRLANEVLAPLLALTSAALHSITVENWKFISGNVNVSSSSLFAVVATRNAFKSARIPAITILMCAGNVNKRAFTACQDLNGCGDAFFSHWATWHTSPAINELIRNDRCGTAVHWRQRSSSCEWFRALHHSDSFVYETAKTS